ncbi:MAG: hypothetical protein RL661_1386 [Pseudomonadota bacterium]
MIGCLLFIAIDLIPILSRPTGGRAPRPNILITRERQFELREDYAQRTGITPDGAVWDALLRQAIDDELLYREARRLSLDAGDRSIRRRLTHKMRAVNTVPGQSEADLYRTALELGLDDDMVIRRLLQEKLRILLKQPPQGIPVSEQDVRDYVERHRDRFIEPDTVSFSHVFLSQQGHGNRPDEQAKALIEKLQSRTVSPGEARHHSDAFLLGDRFEAQSKVQLERHFGPEFAAAVLNCTLSRWCGPIESPFGAHLVWIDRRGTEKLPPLEDYWHQAAQAVSEERAEANLSAGLKRLRESYNVIIEDVTFDTDAAHMAGSE